MTKEIYDTKIVELDGVLQWWDDERSAEGGMGTVRGLTEQLITYLREDDESEEESDDDDDEDMED